MPERRGRESPGSSPRPSSMWRGAAKRLPRTMAPRRPLHSPVPRRIVPRGNGASALPCLFPRPPGPIRASIGVPAPVGVPEEHGHMTLSRRQPEGGRAERRAFPALASSSETPAAPADSGPARIPSPLAHDPPRFLGPAPRCPRRPSLFFSLNHPPNLVPESPPLMIFTEILPLPSPSRCFRSSGSTARRATASSRPSMAARTSSSTRP